MSLHRAPHSMWTEFGNGQNIEDKLLPGFFFFYYFKPKSLGQVVKASDSKVNISSVLEKDNVVKSCS